MEANTYDPCQMMWMRLPISYHVGHGGEYLLFPKMVMEVNTYDYTSKARGEYPLAFIIDIER